MKGKFMYEYDRVDDVYKHREDPMLTDILSEDERMPREDTWETLTLLGEALLAYVTELKELRAALRQAEERLERIRELLDVCQGESCE